jgi:glycine dehydrogenase subunit 2
MKLIFEQGKPGRGSQIFPKSDVEIQTPPADLLRKQAIGLPCLSENEISRHYKQLADATFGMNSGFYPLGSCTMKYNPKVNETLAALPEFGEIHPLQPEDTVQGCLQVLSLAEEYLCEITGMNAMTFQPAAGAHGEYTGLLLIKAYHKSRNDTARTKIIVPDSAHGTNPASASMAGYEIVNIPSGPDGCVDLNALQSAVGEDTAGLMLTNPNTLGIFEKDILSITKIVHEAGGLVYYDGANLNAVMGIARPGDMGFDVVHLNLHKTFSTPHGGGGPGAGAVGCKDFLEPFLPAPRVVKQDGRLTLSEDRPQSIGRVKDFYGNFSVVVKALAYLITLGKEGVREASSNAVLNANYMMEQLKDWYEMSCSGRCMHEFVMSLEPLKAETGVSAMDVAKGLLDRGFHPPTMYFPLIVHEALMIEPTETEPREVLDDMIAALRELHAVAHEDPETLHTAPHHAKIRRPDEVKAARSPVLRWTPKEETSQV